MSLIKIMPIALIVFSLIVAGMYIVSNDRNGGGFWAAYSFSPPSNNITAKYNIVPNISKSFGTDISCDLNPESTDCANKQKSWEDTEQSFVNRLVMGAGAGLTTIYKAFFLPKYVLIELGNVLGVPSFFVSITYNLVLIVTVISLIFIIFTRSDT